MAVRQAPFGDFAKLGRRPFRYFDCHGLTKEEIVIFGEPSKQS